MASDYDTPSNDTEHDSSPTVSMTVPSEPREVHPAFTPAGMAFVLFMVIIVVWLIHDLVRK